MKRRLLHGRQFGWCDTKKIVRIQTPRKVPRRVPLIVEWGYYGLLDKQSVKAKTTAPT